MDKNFTEEYAKMAEEILDILNKYELSPNRFIYTTSDNHKLAHNEILECLARHIKDGDEKDLMLGEYKKAYQGFILDKIDKDETLDKKDPQYCVHSIIQTYLEPFYGSYFYIFDNNLRLTQKEFFSLPCKKTRTFDEFAQNERYITDRLGQIVLNPYRELTLLIQPDGTCYNAQNDHQTCAKWLNVNGIDIDQTIRFETSKQFYDFNFCSLYNYGFSENSNDDEIINITDEQAIVLTDIYKTMCNAWKYLKPLEETLHNCKGFGFSVKDYIPEIGEKNLRTIDEYAGDFFSVRKYIRYLKEKIEEIERLEKKQKETIEQ